ncbi:hypothetical protein [Pseudomonas mosselii]|uniref:Uncharacterized protein n=1 Tax=Pseudomonas mosselii TaxID=78327 RepID=A0ABX9B7K1_9PSED|nr:hypothetical protein [Pseudomonas mosselii]MCL8301989.1 hypothetical protein [Pseudomonas mosselii]MCL8342836.1 hypothetical protein [Pseudomonas mosselii]MCU9530929.1 hypothetical protein [Pseudomonas mosselii]MCU9535972.1 hypothetical protein [Pseudomonas mosselii]MCU9541079.1 hypothetical protein [Pseudomonas mosselii]
MRYLKSFWVFGTLIMLPVIAAALISFFLYRSQFDGEFSTVSSRWSEFGGYIGGVLGPVVSFCTLIAVVRTVYLQRELLDIQKSEFREISSQQQGQLVLAKEEMESARTASYKEVQLRLVEMLIEQTRRQAELIQDHIRKHSENNPIFRPGEYLEKLSKKHNSLIKQEGDLRLVMVELSVTDFLSIEEVRAFLRPTLTEFLKPNGEARSS